MIYVIDTCVFRKLLDHLPRKGIISKKYGINLKMESKQKFIFP